MPDIKKDVKGLADYVFLRLDNRLEGLTDDEYFWEPVPNSWNIRPSADGTFRGDWGVIFDETPPVTTIAWRISHIIDFLSAERCATWLGLEPEPPVSPDTEPGTAVQARELLRRAYGNWVSYLDRVSDDKLWTESGPVAGVYAEHSVLAFVLHIVDELIHHAAEVALLRDLYRAQHDMDPFVTVALAGDREAFERMKAEGTLDSAREQHPNIVRTAAALGRFEAIPMLVEFGFDLETADGRTALHHAAGAGNVEAIRTLVSLGADVNVKDPTYQATPLGWAEYFQRTESVEYLRRLTT